MKRKVILFLIAGLLLAAGLSLSAEEPSLHGFLRHQLGVTVIDTQVVRNTVTAEVALGYRGTDVDLFLNPYFEVGPDTDPGVGLREGYLDYYTNFVDFRVGKQIIIWGKSDGLAITDIVSPKDLSNFLIPDFRELRLGVIAVSANAYIGPAVIEVIYVPVFTPSVLPAPGTVWYTSLSTPVAPVLKPAPATGSDILDGEFYTRLRMQASALDFDLAGGYYWTNEPSPTITKEFSSPGVISSITVTPEHYRQWLVGGAVSSSVGPFILRGEMGYFTPKRFPTTDMADADGYAEKDYLQSLAGVDTVIAGIDLSAQVMHQYIIQHEAELLQDEHAWTVALRARRAFLRDKLVFDAFSYIGLNAPDAMLKTGVTWAPVDSLSIRAEANLFFGDSGQFGAYGDNDLLLVSMRYSY